MSSHTTTKRKKKHIQLDQDEEMNQMDMAVEGVQEDGSAMEIDAGAAIDESMNHPTVQPTITQPQTQPLISTPTRHSTRAASKTAIDRIHSLHLEESKGESRDEEEPMNESTKRSSAVHSYTSGRNKKKRSHPTSDDEHSGAPSDSDSIIQSTKSTTISKSKSKSTSRVINIRSNKRVKRASAQDIEEDDEEVDEDQSDDSEEDEDDQELDESDKVEDHDMVEKKTEMMDESDSESDSDYEAGSKKKKKKMKPSKKKSTTKKEVKEEETKPGEEKGQKTGRKKKQPKEDPYIHLLKRDESCQIALLFALDEIRATGSTLSEAALLGSLLTMTPPIDINLISPRYGDTIASSLFRVMIANRLSGRVMKKIRVNYDAIMKHLKETIDPAVVNDKGRNLVFTISDPFEYRPIRHGKRNRNPEFTSELTKILIDKGGEAMWQQPDKGGRVALFNPARDKSLTGDDLFKLLFPSVTEFKRLMAITDGNDDSVLHCIYDWDEIERCYWWFKRPAARFIDLIQIFMTKPDYFQIIDFNRANKIGVSLLDCVDKSAQVLHKHWLAYSSDSSSRYPRSPDPKNNQIPYHVRALFSKSSLVRREWMEELSKHLIPDLALIVEEYLIFLAPPPDVIRFTIRYAGRWSDRVFQAELSPNSTLVQLKSSIHSAAHSGISWQFLDDPKMSQFVLMKLDPKQWMKGALVADHELNKDDHTSSLVDLGIRAGSVVQVKWSRDVVPEWMQPD